MKTKLLTTIVCLVPGFISAQVQANIEGNEITPISELEGSVLLPAVLLVLLIAVLGGIMVAAQKSKWS